MEMEKQETDFPPSKKPKLESIPPEDKAPETDFTQDVMEDTNEFTVNKETYNDIVPPDEIEKLREFKVLDETKSNDEDSNDENSDSSDGRPIDDDEIDKMLEENLPEGLKTAPKPKERTFYTVSRIFLEEKGVNHFEVLPLDWMMIQHYSGMPLYMHRSTRVCTLSKPYFLGKGDARRHEIPVSAIPCLAYRRALEEEEKQKEIDKKIKEHMRNQQMENDKVRSEQVNKAVNKSGSNNENRLSKTYFGAVCDRTLLGNIKVSEIACQKNVNDKFPHRQEDDKPLTSDNQSNHSNIEDSIDVNNDTNKQDKNELSVDEDSKNTLINEDGMWKVTKRKCPFSQRKNNVPSNENSNKEHNLFGELSNVRYENNLKNENDISDTKDCKNTINKNDEVVQNELTKDIKMCISDIKEHNSVILDKLPDILKDEELTDDKSDFKSKEEDEVSGEYSAIIKTDTIENEDTEIGEKNDEINHEDGSNAEASVVDTGNPENGENISPDDNASTSENKGKEINEKTNFDDILPSRRPVILPGGIVMAPPRVETLSSSLRTQHLTPEQLNEYCKKLFKFKVVKILHFKRWADRRKYNKARKTLQYPALSEGTKLITIPMQHISQANGGRPTKRDWVMSMNGGSYLSVFHEYVGRALQKQPVYEFKNLENAATPYQATVYIGGMQYGVGYGSSKRQAKAAAARASVHILIPEMKDELDAHDGRGNTSKEDPDFSFFDHVGIEDPRIMELCAATCELSPHAILKTCLLRNFGTGERHIQIEMKKLEYQKIELTMKVGKHTATVTCKNKKTAKQRASQSILQALHPHVRSWGSLLRLYGSKSIKSCKEKKVEEQQITLLQDKARHNEPNYAVLEKLRSEMLKLKERDAAFVPIGTFVLTDSLPTHSNSDLNNVDL